MGTIPNISADLERVDEVILTEFIPAITGGIIPNETERKLFSLPPSKGGLGIPIFSEQCDIEFQNSCESTEALQNDIIDQNTQGNQETERKVKTTKSNIQKRKKERIERQLADIKLSNDLSKKTKAYRPEQ